MSNWPASYRSFLMATALCLLTPIPRNGCSNAQPNEDNVVFHFLGDNQLQGGLYPVLCCQYDLTLVCHLEQDMAGFQWYSIQSVDFIMDFRYSLDYWGPFPPEMMPPPSEHVRLCFGSDDFNLAFDVSASCEGSHLSYSREGAPANPFEADFYDACLPLRSCREFHTPLGAQIVYDAGTEFRFGTTDLEGHPIVGFFNGHLIIPPPWAEYSFDFSLLRLQATPASIRYLDAENLRREVTGAVADGGSKVIVEVDGTHSQPSATLPENGGEWIEEEWEEVDDSVWHRTWQAPEDFCVDDEDFHHEDSRIIDFQFRIDGRTVPEPPFYLYKPPVLFLHGLFDEGGSLQVMLNTICRDYFGGNPFLVMGPSYDNDVHFAENVSAIGRLVEECLDRAKHGDQGFWSQELAVKKVDVVAHSMGGILANLYICSGQYTDDVNRIITLDTPHSGSEYANYLLHFIYQEMDGSARQSFLENSFLYWLFLRARDMYINRGAVEDLQVGSDAILNYRAALSTHPDVPVCAVCGQHSLDRPPGDIISLGYRLLWWWDQDVDASHAHFRGLDPLVVEDSLFPYGRNSSDFMVSTLSQAGGLLPPWSSTVYTRDHNSVIKEQHVIEEVRDLLESPKSAFAAGFSPPWTYPEPRTHWPPVRIGGSLASLRPSSSQPSSSHIDEGEVRIIYPLSGTVFAPGDTVHITVTYDGQPDWGMLGVLQTWASALDSSAPWEFTLGVDSAYCGALMIVVAVATEGVMLGDSLTDTVTVWIQPNGTPTTVGLTTPGALYLYPGERFLLDVMGLYPDGIWREVTSHEIGTVYSSSQPTITSVSEDGLVSALSPGEATLHILNGASCDLYVRVFGNPGEIGGPVPPDGALNVSTSTNFDWWGAENATSYDLYVWRASDPEPTRPAVSDLRESFYDPPFDIEGATTYRWRILAKNPAGETQGPVWSFTTTGAIEDELKIAVSPNPFVPSRGHAVLSFFGDGLPYASIRVFNKAGELVRSLEETLGQPRLDWDATSESGNKLASGVYIWVSKSRDGKYTRGKFAIIR